MELRAFGVLQVTGGERRLGPDELGGRKPKQILELLTAERGHLVAKDRLVEALWPERPPQHPVPALENHVWVLRQHLRVVAPGDAPVLVAEAGAYRLAVERVEVDLDRFDALVRDAADADGEDAERLELRALALVRGPVFEDEPYAEWAIDLRRNYATRVQQLRLRLARSALQRGDHDQALQQVQDVLALDPLSEAAVQLEVAALASAGRRDEAIRSFRDYEAALRTELGLEPAPETRAIVESVRRGARTHRGERTNGARSSAPPAVPRSARSALVGRRQEVDTIRSALLDEGPDRLRLVLVEGLAHVGKTRLVEEALRGSPGVPSGWSQVPAGTETVPCQQLASALADACGGRSAAALASSNPHQVRETLCQELADAAPVVLVCDDLHRSDPLALLRDVAYLRSRCAGVPATIVGIHRSEEVPHDHLLRSLAPVTRMRVEPVTEDELLGYGGAEVVAWTGGYGAYLAAWSAGERHPPLSPSLTSSVLERCQAAGPLGYRVLLAASVLAEPFSPRQLATLVGVDLLPLTEELDRLAARGLLVDLGVDGCSFSCRLPAAALASQVSSTRRRLLREVSEQVASAAG